MESILQFFNQSFQDTVFSSAEKQAIKRLIDEYNLNRHNRDFLRSQIFDIARSRFSRQADISVFDWLEVANKTLLDRAPEEAGSVCFSPGEGCLEIITQALHSAISDVQICVFTISDDRITEAILHAHQRGVTVRIITDNEKLYDQGSDIRQLAGQRIPIRIDQTENHMHHKFAIVDRKSVLTGSYNWTRSAALYNHENLVLLKEKRLVDTYLEEFARLWEEMIPYTD